MTNDKTKECFNNIPDAFTCEICRHIKPYSQVGYWSIYRDIFVVCDCCYHNRMDDNEKYQLIEQEKEFVRNCNKLDKGEEH